MGDQLSKKPGAAAIAAPGPSANPNMHLTAELTSYSAACRLDPELQTFDTLAVGVEVRAFSFDSLKEVTGCLLKMDQDVVKVILNCKKNIWKSPELFNLVEDYFGKSLQTLNFCTALEKCLKKARDRQLIVNVALQRFDEEAADAGAGLYQRTLEEIRQFKEAGDPFTDEFFSVLQAVYQQQITMLEKLQMRRSNLDKKLKSLKAWSKVSSIIFAAAFAVVLICSVVAAAMAAPPVAVALAAATAIPLGSMRKWFDSLLKDYENALGQKELLTSMQVGAYVLITDLDGIRVLVDRLEVHIEAMLQGAEFALRGEEAVKVGVDEIRKKLEMFMRIIRHP